MQPTEPSVTEPIRAEMMDVFEAMTILLSALGFPIYESTRKGKSDKELLYCKSKYAEATGVYTEEGLTIFAGSKARKDLVPSMGDRFRAKRQELIAEGVLREEGEYFIFLDDYIFGSPSAAADMVLGSPSNGWDTWKDKAGRTLDVIKRRNTS